MFGGLSAGRTTQPSGSGTQDEVTANSALDDARNEIQNNGILAVGEHVVTQRVPETSQVSTIVAISGSINPQNIDRLFIRLTSSIDIC